MTYGGHSLASFSRVGAVWAALYTCLAICDRLSHRRLLVVECKELSSSTCALLNNLFGMLPTWLLAAATNQVREAAATERWARWKEPQVVGLLLLSGLVGLGISVLSISCKRAMT